MAPSVPPFLRKRTSSTASRKITGSPLLRGFGLTSDEGIRSPLASSFSVNPASSTNPLSDASPSAARPVTTAQLFGGAPLSTTTSPSGPDQDPDFGSSYEGPGAFNSRLHPDSASSVEEQHGVIAVQQTLPSIQRALQQDRSANAVPFGSQAISASNTSSATSSPSKGSKTALRQMKPAYQAANAHEGAWLGGAANNDTQGLSPHSAAAAALRFGTSPGNQSDMSNEAQMHYSNHDALSDISSTGLYDPDHAPNTYPNAAAMADIDQLGNGHNTQSLRGDPNGLAGTSATTPTLADHATYEDARGYVNTSSFDSNTNAPFSSSSTSGQLTSSTSYADPGSKSLFGDSFGNNTSYNGPSSSVSTGTIPVSAGGPNLEDVVPTSFDEGVLRQLCDIDCGMPLLFDRIKQSMVSAREAAAFLKKRAAIEEEYARAMAKLSRSTLETYSLSDAKAGSFVRSWHSMMKTHDTLADNRIRFAAKLGEMSDELNNLAKEVDKSRKQAKETGTRLEKNLQEAEAGVEKARGRFDTAAEDLERLLLLKSGESTKSGEIQSGSGGGGKRTLGKAIGKSGLLFKNKNPQQILKQEEDIRARTSTASDAFRKEVLSTQGMRQEYFNLQLPRILRTLKENAEEIDNGTQYHLARYAFLYESTVLNDGMTISPVGTDITPGSGLKGAVETIDNRADFKQYMANYQVAHGRDYKGPRREGPYEEGFLPNTSAAANKAVLTRPVASERPIFGVDLGEQMTRDNVEVPPILEKCAEAIEQVGIENMGIYRLSGTTSKVQKLRAKFDADWTTVDLMNDEAIQDINIVAGCLKLWFRELPEPLLTHDLYSGFIEAAKIENDRLRHIRLHEKVNELPDANYATLKYLMGHLDKVKSLEHVNQMSTSNLAIVFGPTLLSPPPAGYGADGQDGAPAQNGGMIHDMSFQCRAVETILDKYREIFVDETE